MKISLLRASRLAKVALLKAEKRRTEEREREAAYWSNLEAAEHRLAADWAKRGSEFTAFAKFENDKVVSVRKKRPTAKA